MRHIRSVAEKDAAGLLDRVYARARQRAGTVANIIKVMSLDPPSTQGSMQFYGSLMKRPNALGAARREMLATVVSNVNACYY